MMMERRTDVIEILKTEYGITSLAQLQKAISEMPLLDLAPFCAEPPKRKGECDAGRND